MLTLTKQTSASRTIFNDAVDFIHNNKGFVPDDLKKAPIRKLTSEISSILQQAITTSLQDTSIKYETPQELREALQENVNFFAGMKVFHELKEATLSLIDDKGNMKPFNEFKNDVAKIHTNYNERYLNTEYLFATQSSLMAAKWNDFEQDGDRYNLQYRTAGDEQVREDHKVLHNTTLPVSDPFWSSYTPPLGWRCRCTVVQVRKSKYETSNSTESIIKGEQATTQLDANGVNKAEMFRFNPGKARIIFPERHPYMPRESSPQDVKEAGKVIAELQELKAGNLTKWAKENISGSVIHPQVDRPINFSKTGLKEFINQPHKHYFDKNKLVKTLPEVIKNATYMGVSEYKEKTSHIFEITIEGEKSYIIANENRDKSIALYSITQSNKVLKGIKKP